MAKKPAAREPQERREVVDLEEVYSAEPLSESLGKLYAELGIEGERASFVVVHKIVDESGKEGRIWKGQVDGYDLDSLARRFGSGEYIVRVYVQNESGTFSCRGNRTFSMMLDPSDDARLAMIRNPALAGTQPQVDVVALMREQNDRSMDRMLALLQPLLAGMTGNRQSAIQELKGMAEVFGIGKPAGGGNGGEDATLRAFTMFKQFLDLSKSLTPEKPLTEDEIGPNALMYKGLEFLMDTVRNAKEKQAALPAGSADAALIAAPALPATPVPVMPVALSPNSPEHEEMNLALMMLLRAASKNANVEIYADLVYDEAPDNIIEAMQKPEWFAELEKLAPEVAQFRDWFTRVRERVMEMIAEDAKETNDTPLDSVEKSADTPPG